MARHSDLLVRPESMLTLRTYDNGTKAEFSYDDANRLTLLANKKSDDTVISRFSYEYDKAGNQTKRTRPSETLKYTYDNIYEITEVYRLSPEPTMTLEEFSYDDVGNRTSDADYSDYSYNVNNQLTSYDDITLEYDKNGNLTRRTENSTDVTTYTYDYENRLIRIDYPDETYSAYKYDPLGRRIEKRDRSGNISRYLYDGQNVVAEYNGSNSLMASYVQKLGLDQPISMYRDGEIYYYHANGLGSIYKMTDSNEAVARSYDYSAFGKVISETGTLQNPFTYTAREHDSESGLYYYRARYYDAAEGRFVSRDPIGVSGGINFYAYLKNNPVNGRDPSGLGPYCGPGGNLPWVPDSGKCFDFTYACAEHDACYGQCYDHVGRSYGGHKHMCDSEFLGDMLSDCFSQPVSCVQRCFIQAFAYYHAVDILGRWAYHNAQYDACC